MKRKIPAVLAAVLALALILSACNSKHIAKLDADKITSANALTSYTSSYVYVIEDKDDIKELVKIYNSVRYCELYEDEEPPDLVMDTLYNLRFFDEKNKTVGDVYVSPDGYMAFSNDFDHVYRVTSKFDEKKLISILDKNKK